MTIIYSPNSQMQQMR